MTSLKMRRRAATLNGRLKLAGLGNSDAHRVETLGCCYTEFGATVRDMFTLVESRLEDLPAMAELASRASELTTRLKTRRNSPIGEEFTGPILVEGEASASLLRPC